MKTTLVSLFVLAAFSLSQGAALREAQFTRVINDVKKLPEASAAQTASVGDKITGKTAVSTGAKSRAELKFADGTLTRLGANSIFSLDQGSRTIDLQQGTILLQVPKQMGGAKVRTAAITAAVTGTTIMIEYQPNGYVKVIVLEGSLDLYRNDQPSVFRSYNAGDMAIMKPDSKFLPDAVQVDLKKLKQSSNLTNQDDFGALGNDSQLQGAERQQMQRQQSGELMKTVLVIPGQGTRVTLTADAVQKLTPFIAGRNGQPPGPGAGGPPGPGGPGTPGPGLNPEIVPTNQVHPPSIPGYAVVGDTSTIVTDPTLTAKFNGVQSTAQGRIFHPLTEGTLGAYLFNLPSTRLGPTDNAATGKVDRFVRTYGAWSSFLVDELAITGNPTVDSDPGPKNLILASKSDILLSDTNPLDSSTGSGYWNLNGGSAGFVSITPDLDNLILAAGGNIDWQTGFQIIGTAQNVLLYTQTDPAASDQGSVTITTNVGSTAVNLPNGSFNIASAGDLTLTTASSSSAATTSGGGSDPSRGGPAPPPSITVRDVKLSAAGSVNINDGYAIHASNRISVSAGLDLNITNSSELKRIANSDILGILLESTGGNLNVDGSGGTVSIQGNDVELRSNIGNVSLNMANISADVLKVTTLSPTGEIIIGNSTLSAATGIKLYAQGANGTVHFVANSTLDGATTIAGNTVLVDTGVAVEVTRPNDLNVHANNHRYNNTSDGNFTNGGTPINFAADGSPGAHKHDFNSRPGY